MKTPCSGSSPSAGDLEIGLEAVELAAVAVAADLDVEQAEDRIAAIGDAVGEQDHPAQVPSIGAPARASAAIGSRRP